MSATVHLVLTGQLLPGFSTDAVAAGLSRLLRVPEHQAHGLLAGKETIIKRSLPKQEVPRYLDALAGIGAAARTEPVPAPADGGFPQIAFDEPKPVPVAKQMAPAAVPIPASAPATAPEPKGLPLDDLLDNLFGASSETPGGVAKTTPAPAAPAPAPKPVPSALELVSTPEDTITCPACQLTQPRRTLCRSCGADMPRMLAAKEEAARQPQAPAAETGNANPYQTPKSTVRDHEYSDTTETPPWLGFSLHGRIGRVRYMARSMASMLLVMVLGLVGALLTAATHTALLMGFLMIVGGVVSVWLSLRTLVHRLHDVNLTGKWVLLAMVLPAAMALTGSPYAAGVVAGLMWLASLLLLVSPGNKDDNNYGFPSGPNTTGTAIGAVLWVVMTVSYLIANPVQQYAQYQQRAREKAIEQFEQQHGELTPEQRARLEEMVRQQGQQQLDQIQQQQQQQEQQETDSEE